MALPPKAPLDSQFTILYAHVARISIVEVKKDREFWDLCEKTHDYA